MNSADNETILNMKISIIIACFNAAPVISRCLGSIREQDYPEVEVVVADGGSRDGTVEIVKQYESLMGGSLVWFSEPDQGIADAWNKAIPRASGDWFLFQGADDRLAAPEVLSTAAPILAQAFPTHRVVYGRVAMYSSSGQFLEFLDRPWSPNDFRNCLWNLPHQALFHHRSLFEDHGDFDTTLSIVSDFDFLLRELMHTEPLHIPEFTVSNMQWGGISTNRRYMSKPYLEQIRLYKRHTTGGTPLILYRRLPKAWAISMLYRLFGDSLALSIINAYRRVVVRRPPIAY